MGFALGIVVFLYYLIAGFGCLWALNTLGFQVAYGFWQWVGACVILLLFGQPVITMKGE